MTSCWQTCIFPRDERVEEDERDDAPSHCPGKSDHQSDGSEVDAPEIHYRKEDMLREVVVVVISQETQARLEKEYRELKEKPIEGMRVAALPENLLEWHYVIKGALKTPFEGGEYHGKIVFSADFPLCPPSVYMMTPTGRFKTDSRIVLSIDNAWKPSWRVRNVLEGFFVLLHETEFALDSPWNENRKQLARESKAFNIKDAVFCELFMDLAESTRRELTAAAAVATATAAANATADDGRARRTCDIS